MKVSISRLFALMFIAFVTFVLVAALVYIQLDSYVAAAICGAVAGSISIASGVGWVRQSKEQSKGSKSG